MLIIFCSSYTKGEEKEHTEMPRPKYSLLLMSKIYLKVVYKEENLNRQQLYVCLYTIQLEVSSSEKIQASCFLYALFIVNQQTSALCLPNVGSRAPVDIMAQNLDIHFFQYLMKFKMTGLWSVTFTLK